MAVEQELIHSNAFNFDGFLAGGVDPRTGIYTCSLTLGELKSGFLQGPSLPIRLFFSPLQGSDIGYGKGWSLPLTQYNVVTHQLTLSGAERYKARETSSRLVFDELKLEILKVLRPAPGRFDVVHKNGLTEELHVYAGSDLAVPKRIVSANGAAIHLDYSDINGEPVLSAVRDATRTLLTIVRTAGQVMLTLYPDSECAAPFILKRSDDQVRAVQLPDGGVWSLDSEVIGGVECLTQVTSPLGARELIYYEEAGHRLPPDAPRRAIPHVMSHTVFPGSQPPITTHYSFSQTNFLGFDDDDNVVRWSREGDTLYQLAEDYRYFSVESLMNGKNVHRSIKRTYNKYHLLVSQETTCNQSVTTRTVSYHLEPGKGFLAQPAQFRMPKVQTLRYENRKTKASREEVTTTLFDAWGNLLKHIAPNGVVTVSEFYPASGAEGCPADPLGFVRFEKSRTVRAADGLAQAATTQLRFRYKQIGKAGEPGCDVVLEQQALYERAAEGDVLRSQTDLHYAELIAGPQVYVVLQKQTVHQNGEDSETRFKYLLDGTTLEVQTLQVGFDQTRRESSVRSSAINGLKRSEQNEDQGRVDFTYDRLGRELSKTVAAGDTFESGRRSSFLLEKQDGRVVATKLDTDASGLQTKYLYDGLGRIREIQEQDPQHADEVVFRPVYEAQYDALGQLTGEKKIDWWRGERHPFITRFAFDDWGQVKTTLHPDGRQEHCEHDPVLRKKTTWQAGMGKTVTVFNAFGKPDRVEWFDTSGTRQGQQFYTYDGLGRTVGQTDAAGHRTTFAYDVFDRLTLSTLPDGSAVQTAYAAHSQEALPISVTVAGKMLGQQVFDGLGRLTQSTLGGRSSQAGYERGRSQPAWKQRPDGKRIDYLYEPGLGGVVTQREAEGLLARYDYHPRLAVLTRCVEQGCETRLEYDRFGRLTGETSIVDKEHKSASYTYSLGGRPLSCIDVLGEPHETDYDEAGRPRTFTHRALKTTFTYNPLGQLASVVARALQGSGSMVTRLAYDDFGREVSRTFEFGEGVSQVLSSTYTPTGKLARKTLKQDKEVLRDEHFTYDSRGRLSLYACEGTQRPRDPQGKEIIQQQFTFDALDNILTLETRFPGGENLATFEYSATDPTQLTGISNDHADYPTSAVLQYDDNGHLVKDEQGRRIDYDALGRLIQVTGADNQVIRDLRYDARDRLVELAQPSGPAIRRFYQEGRQANDLCGSSSLTSLRSGGFLLGQDRQGGEAGVGLLGVDQQQSVLTEVSVVRPVHFSYSPYGHRVAPGGLFSLPGFSGEQLDAQTGLYLLGNGYRAYSPTLMRFLSPDDLSPFGAGGLNPYTYCAGDPINRVDPTGHFWEAILSGVLSFVGIAASVLTLGAATPLAVVSLALGVASGVVGATSAALRAYDVESQAADVLDWISLGLGAASFASGLGAAGKAAAKVGNRLNQAFAKGLSPTDVPVAAKIGSKSGTRAAATSSATGGSPAKGPWRIKLAPRRNIAEKIQASHQNDYDLFKNAIHNEGVDPATAVRRMGDANPKRLQSSSNHFRDHQGNPVCASEMWEARIGGSQRVTYLVEYKSQLVTVLQVGGHT